jgi:hypothetical protein
MLRVNAATTRQYDAEFDGAVVEETDPDGNTTLTSYGAVRQHILWFCVRCVCKSWEKVANERVEERSNGSGLFVWERSNGSGLFVCV